MRVAILTSGRFHVLDLARELDALGYDVAFYSLVPKWRTRHFGLPDRVNRCLMPYLAPLYAAKRVAGYFGLEHGADHLLLHALDEVAARFIERCDVLIGMSGITVKAAEAVRHRYGARVWIERGSRHILSQKEILDAIPGATRRTKVPAWAVRRELVGYDLADRIVVPSRHAEVSFIERGISPAKLFRNPFGVDLTMFPPTPAPPAEPPVIVYVGAWSLRKGCDVLVEAWRRLGGVRLIHVGSVVDAPLPQHEHFEHHEAVPQWRLAEFYARGHVFAMCSREEGLALVQVQALACGLHLVCTDRTGGEDLKEFLEDPSLVTVVPHDDAVALAEALRAALGRACKLKGLRDYLGGGRHKLSWREYGRRYDAALRGEV